MGMGAPAANDKNSGSASAIIFFDFLQPAARRRKCLCFGILTTVVLDILAVFSNGVGLGGFVNNLVAVKAVHSNDLQETDTIDPSEIWNGIWERAVTNATPAKVRPETVERLGVVGALAKDLNQTQQLFDIFPKPRQPTSVQIYNETTYQELIKSFVNLRSSNSNNDNRLTVCANGGSSTAAAGTERLAQYLEVFARCLNGLIHHNGSANSSYKNGAADTASGKARNSASRGGSNDRHPSIETINRGHGARTSLHSSVFSANFLPPEADLLFWEFAINDHSNYFQKGNFLDPATLEQEHRSLLLAWLREVEQLRQPHRPPPKVILIYLWSHPFQRFPVATNTTQNASHEENQFRVYNPVFSSHAYAGHYKLAREFDFVVGHVNLASYIDELRLPSREDAGLLFLRDRNHPNRLGHMAISFLLLNLLSDRSSAINHNFYAKQEGPLSPSIVHHNETTEREKFIWNCGTETNDKRIIQSLIVGGDLGWRSPLGTMSMELPQNKPGSGGPKQLIVDTGHNLTTTILGKQDPLRMDRQGAMSLPCCRNAGITTAKSNSSSTRERFQTETRTMTVHVPIPKKPMRDVQAIFFCFGKSLTNVSNLKVYINDEIDYTAGKLVRPIGWPCFWGWEHHFHVWWFIFPEAQPIVSSISVCIENEHCLRNDTSEAWLQNMAVY